MDQRKSIPGKFVWFELVSADAKKAQEFYGQVFGWRVEPFPVGQDTYEMIKAGDDMLGGYAQPRTIAEPSHWIAYVSVEDVDAAVHAALESGGTAVEAPSDIPGVGRRAGILDPQGAELHLLHNTTGDPPEEPVTHGHFVWSELHTSDPKAALAFYEKVVGFTHSAMEMGGGDVYYVLNAGDVGRGGVTGHLRPGVAPYWLPYVFVDDADATVARAQGAGAEVVMKPEDIPDVGRLAVLRDPTGAVFAILKPRPRQQQS